METLVVLALVSHILLSSVVIFVGLMTIVVLFQVKKTLVKLNEVVDSANDGVKSTFQALQSLSTYAMALQAGVKALESVIDWAKEKKQVSE